MYLLLLLAMLVLGLTATRQGTAQAMAHRGWAGAGTTAEPWWHRAVFYRIDPARFQASGEGSTGDLAGVASRLDYLQSLGVDALLLEPATTAGATPTALFAPDALESLIREAGRHNLRVVPTLTPTLERGNRLLLLQTVHDWLGEGAAGVALSPASAGADGAEASSRAALVSLLADILRSTPGDRVLLAGAPIPSPAPTPGPAFLSRSSQARRRGLTGAGSGRLTTAANLPSAPVTSAVLRSALTSLLSLSGSGYPSGYPLIRLTEGQSLPSSGSADSAGPPALNSVAAAAALLASPAAALFDFGAELGLDTGAPGRFADSDRSASSAPLMQWTPTNIRPAPVERPIPVALPVPGQPTPFGAYTPFVRPPPHSLTGTVPAGPAVELDRDIPPPPPDPSTLPGFTAGRLPVASVDGATLNVATQARDPRSVLNAFRDLLALRRGNPALRDGTQLLLIHAGPANAKPAKPDEVRGLGKVLVFLRPSPAGVRSAGVVVVAANLGALPMVLSLDSALVPLHLRSGPVRALFSYGPQTLTGESTAALRLPPHAVFVGELPKAGR